MAWQARCLALEPLLGWSTVMLIGVAVGIHGYDGPGASVFVFGTVALIVLILVAVYRPRKRR